MLVEVTKEQQQLLLVALKYFVEENYSQLNERFLASLACDFDVKLLSEQLVEELVTNIVEPGEIRYLLYDYDECVVGRNTYALLADAMDDQYFQLPDVIVRPFLTGGDTSEVDDADS